MAKRLTEVLSAINRHGAWPGAAIVALIFGAIAYPGRLCCGARGPEAMAIHRLRAINSAQQAFSSSCANGRYARTLEDLASPAGEDFEPFLKRPWSLAITDEYEVTLTATDVADTEPRSCNGRQVGSTYFAEAHPIDAKSRRRFFATDARGTIYMASKPIGLGMKGASPLQ